VYSTRHCCEILIKFEISRGILEKHYKFKFFMKIRPVGAVMFHAGRHINTDSERLAQVSGFFVGAFAKLRKATIRFVMSVRMEQLCSHWMDFHEI